MTVRARVLLVDDLAPVRVALARLLGTRYEVFAAASMQQALAQVAAGARFDVAVIDLDMPDMDGFEGLLALRTLDPRLARQSFIFTGAPPTHPRLRAAIVAGCRVLHKSATRAELEEAIEAARALEADGPS